MKLLAAIDLARSAPAVLRETRAWTRRLAAELVLLHVADPDPDFRGYGAQSENLHLAATHRVQRAEKQLEAFAVEFRKDGLDTTALLVQGAVAESILREADRLHADAILMGVHARGPGHESFIGGTARQVVGQSSRPVILVPPPAPAP